MIGGTDMKVGTKGRGRLVSLVAIGLFGWACSSGTTQDGTALGVWPTEQWPTSTPAAEGIDPTAVDSLIADIDAGAYGLVDHFLLIRNGRVVADRHFVQDYDSVAALYDTTNHQYNYDDPAWHPYYQDTDLHTLQSVTKSVTSAALGIAIDDGLIEVDEAWHHIIGKAEAWLARTTKGLTPPNGNPTWQSWARAVAAGHGATT